MTRQEIKEIWDEDEDGDFELVESVIGLGMMVAVLLDEGLVTGAQVEAFVRQS